MRRSVTTGDSPGGYRASHNYRDKDPRPRNTASDLSFSAGGGYRLGTYRIGVSADFRYYQQYSEISFLADKGSTSVYHVLGLGMDYARFAGNICRGFNGPHGSG